MISNLVKSVSFRPLEVSIALEERVGSCVVLDDWIEFEE
jgi:hypothetical protein